MSALVTTLELADKIDSPQLRIVDASWHMALEKRNAYEEYIAEHIPGAVFFDIDKISDYNSPYPHMLPSAEIFAKSVAALGIGNDDEIVVYDTTGLFSAARVWWMFRVFGHEKVKVLDGGLPKWKAEYNALESGPSKRSSSIFQSHFNTALVRNFEQIKNNIEYKQELLLDARSPGRFLGTESEPRAGLPSGHIENSINIFFRECLAPPYNTLKSITELRAVFEEKTILSQKFVASCGSGVTACILALALYELGNKNVAVYDGAWAEWGSKL